MFFKLSLVKLLFVFVFAVVVACSFVLFFITMFLTVFSARHFVCLEVNFLEHFLSFVVCLVINTGTVVCLATLVHSDLSCVD